jgi:hypothetical protein
VARFLVKILIALCIAMALGNANCVAQCLVQPCQSGGGDHCHTQGKPNAGGCAHQHEMAVSSAVSAASHSSVLLFIIPVASTSVDSQPIWRQIDNLALSPPPLRSAITPQPLRI